MKVAIVMGSTSDMPVMEEAISFLKEMGIETFVDIVSAHRTPEKLIDFGKNAHKNGINVIIAGAGGAAHLPGMLASVSPLPVILQMPAGVPVATVALNGAKNAGILAMQILGANNEAIRQQITNYKKNLEKAVLEASKDLNN